jgi:acyl-CoA thioester hydrolase
MENNFRHRYAIEIRFADMDALGHVNNANHFTYFEQARIDYFKTVIGENINWAETGLILAHAEIDYKKPIVLGDFVIIYTKVSRIGTKSFDVIYKIVKLIGDKEIELAIGKTVLVCFDYKKNSSIEIPLKWKKAIMEYDKIES